MLDLTLETILESILTPRTYSVAPDACARATVAIDTSLNTCSKSCSCCDSTAVCLKTVRSLAQFACEGPLVDSELHGYKHWMSVYRNAVMVAEVAGLHTFSPYAAEVSPDLDFTAVAILFALFHDCRRNDDGHDVTHGAFGAHALLSYVNSGKLEFTDEVMAAVMACSAHTVVETPASDLGFTGTEWLDNPLITAAVGMCLDADRIDLRRLGIEPNPRFLYHKAATLSVYSTLTKNEPICGF